MTDALSRCRDDCGTLVRKVLAAPDDLRLYDQPLRYTLACLGLDTYPRPAPTAANPSQEAARAADGMHNLAARLLDASHLAHRAELSFARLAALLAAPKPEPPCDPPP